MLNNNHLEGMANNIPLDSYSHITGVHPCCKVSVVSSWPTEENKARKFQN
jgi:hypothetical protein